MSEHLEHVRNEVRDLLRNNGLRCTSARIAVLVILHEAQGPRTHEQIMASLPRSAFDKASVWRILSDLADSGILQRMDLGDRVWRYELIDACRTINDDHAHFLCESCGDVSCLPPLEVRSKDGQIPDKLAGADFKIRVTGRCGDCIPT